MLTDRPPIWPSRLLRRLAFSAAAMLATAAAGLLIAYGLARNSIPEYDGARSVDGLAQPVSILRTQHAIPHIFGETDADVWFALGYAHAQDRLWQMLMSRAAVQGRLSERLGADALDFDRRMRVLGLYRVAERNYLSLPRDAIDVLEAYARGVNARLADVAEQPMGRGAPELFLFSTGEIERWHPADSIGVIKLMALRLSGDLDRELQIGRFRSLLPERLVRDLFPPYLDRGLLSPGAAERPAALKPPAEEPPGGIDRPTPVFPNEPAPAPGRQHGRPLPPAPGDRRASGGTDAPTAERVAFGPSLGVSTAAGGAYIPGHAGGRPGAPGGSNAWAVAGSRSTSGHPLLANDRISPSRLREPGTWPGCVCARPTPSAQPFPDCR